MMSLSLTPWLIVGFVGQMLFTGRFVVQWIASERARRSVVPMTFWVFSVAGGAILLAYAVYREDPVFIFGQAAGLLIYGRNIYFVVQERLGRAQDEQGSAVVTENLAEPGA